MPMSSQANEVRCPDCGFPVAEANERIMLLEKELETKEDNLRDLEIALRAERSKVSRLRGERDKQKSSEPLLPQAEEVFIYWQEKLAPQAREFSGKRFDNVIARLKHGATVEELKEAIDGCAKLPYVDNNGRKATGRPSERQADLELICRTEAHVTRFRSYAQPEPGPAPTAKGDLIPPARVRQLRTAIWRRSILGRLNELRGWSPEAVRKLGLGFDGRKVIFFAYDEYGNLTGLSSYQPNPAKRSGPKNVATGQRELFPGPETLKSTTAWLVEGEPDAVSIVSMGLPGVAVPGVGTWKKGWAARFTRFEKVYVCFDCDEKGREAAAIRTEQLSEFTTPVIVDLDPARDDGYDVTDLLLEKGDRASSALISLATVSGATQTSYQPFLGAETPYEKITRRLTEMDMRVKEIERGRGTSTCPNHDDRHPSLSIAEGDDGRVLIHCHTGCDPSEIVQALGLQLRDLFPQRGA
jgi:hypothetical protein